MEADVLEFLKPSSSHGGSPRAPRIDVAAAQRWPGAADFLTRAAASNPQSTSTSPVPSSMRSAGERPSRPRSKSLAVGFINTAPEIIGEGGDEAEEPPIDISRRRVARARAAKEGRKVEERDLGRATTVSHRHERSEYAKRAHTSWAQMSPSFQQRFSRPKSPPPAQPPPSRDQSEPDIEDEPNKNTFRRGSGPSGAGEQSALNPNRDHPDPHAGQRKRSQTGPSEMAPDSNDSSAFRLPELEKVASEDSVLEMNDELSRYLAAEPTDPDSFSARVQHQMNSDEGKALHEGAAHTSASPEADPAAPISSSSAFDVGSPHSISSNSNASARAPHDQGGYSTKDPYQTNPFVDPSADKRHSHSSSGGHLTFPSSHNSPTDTAPSRSLRDLDRSPFTSPPPTNRNLLPGSPQPPPHPASPGVFSPEARTPTQQDFDGGVKSPPIGLKPSAFPQHPMKSPLAVDIPKQPARSPGPDIAPWSTTSSHRDNLAAAGDAAFDDFAERVTHMRGIFRLTAEIEKPMFQYTPLQWIRAAQWWFLKGRAGLEILIRNRPRSADGSYQPGEQKLAQAHVDLAKAWWILAEMTNEHPGVKNFGNVPSQADAATKAGDEEMAQFWEAQEAAMGSLKGLLISVQRNQVMPPESSLIQGQDQNIWVKYPTFALDAQTVLAGKARGLVMDESKRQISPRAVMPLSDTKDDFCYGRMFVTVSVTTDEEDGDSVALPCVLSIMRPRNDWQVKVGICSQSELLTVSIQGDPKKGCTWDDVKWKSNGRGLTVRLPRGFTLSLDLNEKDYKQLWGICEYTRTVEASLQPRENEALLHEVTLKDLQYRDPENPALFGNERLKRSRVRVFEKTVTLNEGTGQRKFHRGYRLLLITSPKSKTLSSVSHEFTGQRPLVFEFKGDPADENTPLMVLRLKEGKKKTCSAYLTFHEGKERVQLFQFLNGLMVGQDEMCWAQLPLTGYRVEQLGMKDVWQQGHDIVKKLRWQDVKVMNADPEDAESELPDVMLSENLRVVCRHSCGSVTDRMNFGPSEMLVRLDNSGGPELHMLRLPQEDATAAVDAKRAEAHLPDAVSDLLRTVKTSPSVRTYSFPSLKELHQFQTAVTGFRVQFDGIASSFAISRRRMVVPIYKRWEASQVRVQLVIQENVCQLLAFFEDFSHADSMNFQLKSMDVFEKVELKGSKGEKGRFGLKLVDAKFALPREKRKDEEGLKDDYDVMRRRFACLDMPDYPGEHDDITLGFENEADRDRFAENLPAATQLSRLISFKRKI
ncbi:uncharacterized protein K452DRAFT_223714 [Aplosporella prunicola CBS 121167]|uniref:Uncharacterized protein n=1 Tax=Aplosporella prunicola CBS 121167 TaxID=1176127 RepID=A0A6A6BL22_9PEZI|nr:uncharacterized protein K452DRAFT_223714 [Aplosporella prunicola CBS 121167]KAF2144015.1 hypothetical protein K452DRAFT_223714 [Aplosporella prunicola CBS 121167]